MLRREFPAAELVLDDALTYCDMTTDPDGQLVSVDDRLAEISERYGPGHIVTPVHGVIGQLRDAVTASVTMPTLSCAAPILAVDD